MSSSRAVHFGDGKVHVQRKRDHDILRAIPAEPKRVELSARDLLATISERRIAITEITFASNSPPDGGTYAEVMLATLLRARSGKEDRRTVAVKKIRFVLGSSMTEEKFLRLFVNELLVLESLSHPNIVEIIGFVEDVQNRIAWLVFPWEENGNLREFLRSEKWELPERVSLIQDVAFGVEYLHARQPPICHGDLKSLNILVNSEHRAMITDFGSARIIREARECRADLTPHSGAFASCLPPNNSECPQFKVTPSGTALTLTGPAYSFRWGSPEVLGGEAPSLPSDIWALGWIAWEAITDCYPFEELNKERDITMRILKGQLPSVHDHNQLAQIQSLCSLMQSCWKQEPRERPLAAECSRSLKWIPAMIPGTKGDEQLTIRSAALFWQLGEIHGSQSRYKEAQKMYEQGLAIALSSGDRSGVAHFLLRMAEVHRVREEYAEAEASYTLALAIHRAVGNEMGRAQALAGLGRIQRARSSYIEAEASFTQAMAIHKSIGDNIGQADALVGLGYVQTARSYYGEAEASFTQALAIHESMGNDRGRTEALVGLGHAQSAYFNYDEAEASYNKAVDISDRIGNDVGRACAFLGLGHIQRARSNHSKAEVAYNQAVSIYQRIGCNLRQAEALLGLGHVQRALSKYATAEASYTQAMAIHGSVGNDPGRACVLIELGHVQVARFNYDEAKVSFNRAMAIFRSIGHDIGRARALVGLGHVQRACSHYVEAEAAYTQAMAICGSIKYDLGRADSSLGLGELRLHQSRYWEAKTLIEDAARISDLLSYDSGKRTSRTLLEEIVKAEKSSTTSQPLPLASLEISHAEESTTALAPSLKTSPSGSAAPS